MTDTPTVGWHRHRWTRWTDVVMVITYADVTKPIEAIRQRRDCIVCGKSQYHWPTGVPQ